MAAFRATKGKSIKGTSIDGNKRPITGRLASSGLLLASLAVHGSTFRLARPHETAFPWPPSPEKCLYLSGGERSRLEMEWMSLSSCPPNHAAVPDSQTLPMAHYNNSQLSEPLGRVGSNSKRAEQGFGCKLPQLTD